MTYNETDLKRILVEKKENLEKELASHRLQDPLKQEEDLEGEADQVEEYAAGLSIGENLEAQLADVNLALSKIDRHAYGACEACGMSIEAKRLEALPEARTCEHCAKK
ncbi:MAG: TraR/DksA C4-type zinc finger protein [Candidatus Wildermuthbacteria bacterium]|nr:TraR/DksA C4-type zinc finger protein [Candidatus Wildermuthbacteria bacterium]